MYTRTTIQFKHILSAGFMTTPTHTTHTHNHRPLRIQKTKKTRSTHTHNSYTQTHATTHTKNKNKSQHTHTHTHLHFALIILGNLLVENLLPRGLHLLPLLRLVIPNRRHALHQRMQLALLGLHNNRTFGHVRGLGALLGVLWL